MALLPRVNKNLIYVLIPLIALTGFIAVDIYFPSLPAIGDAFLISDSLAQATVTAYLCGFASSQLVYGPLSDHWGRRPILLVGLVIFIVGSIGCIFAPSIDTLIAARLIQGLGAGAGATLVQVLLRDLLSGRKLLQISSYQTIVMSTAFALAPALGGYIQEYFNFIGNFIFMLAFGSITLLLIILFLPETNQHRMPYALSFKKIRQNYFIILKNKIFMAYVLLSGLSVSVFIAYAIINPFLLQDNLGLSAEDFGFYSVLIAVGELIGAAINSQLVAHVNINRLILFGILLAFLAGGIILTCHLLHIFNLTEIIIACTVATVSTGFILPNINAKAFSLFNTAVGTAGAVFGFTQIFIVAVVTCFIAYLDAQAQQSLAIVFIGLAAISLLAYFYVIACDTVKVAKS